MPGTPRLAALALLAAACAPAMYMHRFAPERVDVDLDLGEGAGTPVRVSAAVAGIRQPNPEAGRWSRVEVRLRVENRSRRAVALEPRSIWLTSADLRSIGRAAVSPEPRPLEPGELVDYLIAFPFERDESPYEYDLRRLTLTFALDTGVERIRARADFVLVDPLHDPGLERPYDLHRH